MRVTFTKSMAMRRWSWRLQGIGVNAGSVSMFRTRFFCKRDFKKYYLQMKRKRDYWPPISEVKFDRDA